MTWTATDDPVAWPEGLVPILANLGVTAVNLQTATRPPSFRGGDIGPDAQRLTRQARTQHSQRGYGFWEEVLAHIDDVDPMTRHAILAKALEHDKGIETLDSIPFQDFATQCASGAFRDQPARRIVSICSTMHGADGFRHLPMLDLRTSDVSIAIDVMEALDMTGVLVASGRSFHYFGDTLISPADLAALLGRAVLLAPLTDQRWAAHQVINGFCALRISTDKEKHQGPSRLCASNLH